MESVNASDYSAKQLRGWARLLNLPISGSKPTLALRLNEVPIKDRGICPDEAAVASESDGEEFQESVESLHTSAENLELELMKKELDLLKREKELLARENELLKKEKRADVVATQVAGKLDFNFATVKDMVPDFDGRGSVELWITQFVSVGKMFSLTSDVMKTLLWCKLKGNAQSWLFSKVDYASTEVEVLITEMGEAFRQQSSKLQLRRQFESIKWIHGETFSTYFNKKMLLSNNLQMSEQETVEHLIEGITDLQLRTQATIQCYDTPEKLLRAFSKVEMRKFNKTNTTLSSVRRSDEGSVRCYNCNSVGHYAASCVKPKREPGACYGCGRTDHKVTTCPERKMVHVVEDCDNVRTFRLYLKENIVIYLSCLIDSGSPISFVKEKCVPENVKIKKYNKIHFGLNKSPLKIVGVIFCSLHKKVKAFSFIVVTNDSMGYDAVVGRDFMKCAGIKLVYDTEENENSSNKKESYNTEKVDKIMKEDKCSSEIAKTNTKNDCLKFELNDSLFKRNFTKMIAPIHTIGENDCTMLKKHSTEENNDCEYEIMKEEENSSEIANTNTKNDCLKFELNDSLFKRNFTKMIAPIHKIGENDCTMLKKDRTKEEYHEWYCPEIFLTERESSIEERNYKIGEELSFEEKALFEALLENDYFKVQRPPEPKIKCFMKLRLKDLKPFHCPPRRLSYAEKNKLQILLEEYLDKGYIRASESEFVSPIVLVKKKTGELRMCVDFRTLNKVTEKDNYPIPLIDDLLDRLANKKYFTKLDLKNGFFHVFMDSESVKYTSFITPLGQYEFVRMPFGLRNAPSVFQRFVNKVFMDMLKSGEVIIYLDDIMIATQEVDKHFEILSKVLKRLVENNLELRLDKCEFLRSEVKYLGYMVTGQGIKPDEKGITAVQNFPVPKTARSVQSFLGLCSYFRRFVKDFSLIAKPLYDLTRKTDKFIFGPRELESFENLKQKLVDSPILAIYDPNDPIELHCDASSLGFGSILLQKKSDGKWHPIFYFSKRTTEAESRYHSFELETLSIIYALQRFRIYLQGRNFKIITDCNSLALTLNKKDLNHRIARWALDLQNYDYILEHRAGRRMQHVDALSRNNILTIEANTFEDNLIICQNKDAKLRKIKEMLEKQEHKFFEMRNGIVYRKKEGGSILFYVPESMESRVIYKYHDELGHVGIDKVVDTIGRSYWFPNVKYKVNTHIQNCLRCITFSDKPGRVEGFLHNIPKNSSPFEVIHIDHIGPLENPKNCKKHILVIVDSSTKFTRLYTTRTTKSKEAIHALKDYFRAYSRPRCIISDRGSCFTSNEFKSFLSSHNVQHIKIATGSPQANGQVERVNRSIGPMLAKLSDPVKDVYWDKVVESVEYTLNNTIHRTINEHPSIMLFGVSQKGKIVDNLKENFIEISQDKKERDLEDIRKNAKTNEEKLQLYNTNYVNKKRKEPHKYKEDDYVMVRNFDSHVGVSKKLIPKFKGPYKVQKVLRNDRYILVDVDGFQQTQLPYKGVWAIENIRPWPNTQN